MPSYCVTGAARGLGYAFIKLLASDPSNTVIGLARNPKALEDRLAADGLSHVHALAADITDESSLKLAAEKTSKILGSKGLDVFINNAAYVSDVTAIKSLRDFEANSHVALDDLQKSLDINVFGVLKTVYAFLPLIKKGSLKKVVAISSGMGDIDFINNLKVDNGAPYGISKAALSATFAKLGTAYEQDGILFMTLCPGSVDTDANYKNVAEEDLPRLKEIGAKFAARQPNLRMYTPEESAKYCLAAIARSSLEGGQGGSFLSHNGTRNWMEPMPAA